MTEETKNYLKKLKDKFGDNYDYSKVEYKGWYEPITIKCLKHNIEVTKPAGPMLYTKACPKCAKESAAETKRKRVLAKTEEWVLKAKEIHGDAYDYTNTVYKGSNNPITFKCNSCGKEVTLTKAYVHIGKDKSGCRECKIKKQTKTTEEFIKEAKAKHGNLYDYSKTKYVNASTKVIITCPVHGDFEMFPGQHVSKKDHGRCPQCSKQDKFEHNVLLAKKLHNNKYEYPEQEYKGYRTPIKIVCPIHGTFYQSFNSHLAGSGCQLCAASIAVKKLANIFNKNNLHYALEYSLPNSRYKYDFYLTDLNILLEYDGAQHFKENKLMHGKHDTLEEYQKRDNEKNQLAKIYNIPLIRIPYTMYNQLEKYFWYKLSQIYRYKYNGHYVKDTKELLKISNKTLDELKPLSQYLVYDSDKWNKDK